MLTDLQKALTFVRNEIDVAHTMDTDSVEDLRRIEVLLMKQERLTALSSDHVKVILESVGKDISEFRENVKQVINPKNEDPDAAGILLGTLCHALAEHLDDDFAIEMLVLAISASPEKAYEVLNGSL